MQQAVDVSIINSVIFLLTAVSTSARNFSGYPISQNLTASCEGFAEANCADLPPYCVFCFSADCTYGEENSVVSCRALVPCKSSASTSGNNTFTWRMNCRFCYQIPPADHYCVAPVFCRSGSHVETSCTVNSQERCMGYRVFRKKVRCNWCSGYSWWTALLLSVFLGGFGFDRFYLGWWKEGLGKLFSFGGLGVWTVLDAILISIGYLGPADGSLYI